MLLVQKFLENHTFAQLEEKHGVFVSFNKTGYKFSCNYGQLEAKEDDPLAQECRGLVLSIANGKSLASKASPADGRLNYKNLCPGRTEILAYPMKRFFNAGQGAAAKINWSDPQLSILEKMDGCFTYDTLIKCWDGSVIKIGEIVKKRLNPILIGMDKNGNLVPTQITNWFDNGTKTNWLQIETTLKSKGKNRKFKITSNHSVFINNEFKPIMDAKIGDTIYSYENIICDWTKHLIRSSLLGDGTLSKNGKDFKFEEGHKKEHAEYLLYLEKWLGECFSNKGNYISDFKSEMIRVSSKPNKIISDLRKEWYIKNPNGGKDIKIIPQDLSWIDDFSIAKWFMDDGSLAHDEKQKDRALFATNGFAENEVQRLGKKLQEMYGVSFAVFYNKGWCLRINAGYNDEIDKFWQAISPFIVPCMRYKLPLKFRNYKFNDISESGKIIKIKKEHKILSISELKNNKENFKHGRVGYDIETTTHNYIADGFIVHNSLCIVYFDHHKDEWCVATRSVCEADLIMDNGIYTFRTLFEKAVQETLGRPFDSFIKYLRPEITYCFELTTPYNRIVVKYDECKITLLAMRENATLKELDINSSHLMNDLLRSLRVKKHRLKTLEEIVNFVSTQNPLEMEGVVILDSQFNRIKVKNALYVAFNKAHDQLGNSRRNRLELILSEKDDDIIGAMPPDIAEDMVNLKKSVKEVLSKHDLVFTEIVNSLPNPTKKDFALVLQQRKDLWSAPLFSMFDKKILSMKDFVDKSKKEGTWSNSFLDKLLQLSDENFQNS